MICMMFLKACVLVIVLQVNINICNDCLYYDDENNLSQVKIMKETVFPASELGVTPYDTTVDTKLTFHMV